MKKILYFDVDNTICNSTKRFVEIYNEIYNEQADWTQCYQWDYLDICPKLKEPELIFAREDFYNDKLNFKDKYIYTVIKLLYLLDYEIHFVTIGSEDNLKYKTDWLIQKFPYVPIENYHLLHKLDMGKEEVDMKDGIIIDDNFINLSSSNASLKICMHKIVEWNEDVEANGFIRLKDGFELYEFLYMLEKRGGLL